MGMKIANDDYAIDISTIMYNAAWIGERERDRVTKALTQLPRHTLIPLLLHITDAIHMTKNEQVLWKEGRER